MPKRVDEALARLAEEYDGIENFHAEREAMSHEAKKAWSADVLNIGRVLRSHLYVEYYLNKYLKEKYRFSARKIAPLSFFDKVEIIRKITMKSIL